MSKSKPAKHLLPQQIPRWRDYIERKIGFVLPEEQLRWLVNAVEYTARKYQLSFEDLWQGVQSSQQLRQQLLDEVLILESRFFRHPPSIEFISHLACDHQDQALVNEASPFRIWSLGCATGQEVWSLAMSLKAQAIKDFEILGTDASQKALAQAQSARYNAKQIIGIPAPYQHFLIPLEAERNQDQPLAKQQAEGCWQVSAELQSHVRFVWHNIFGSDLPADQPQDVIICQNMLIYFRKFDQRDILRRLSQQCRLGGHIVLAPGEGLGWSPKNMRKLRHPTINAWQKISRNP